MVKMNTKKANDVWELLFCKILTIFSFLRVKLEIQQIWKNSFPTSENA